MKPNQVRKAGHDYSYMYKECERLILKCNFNETRRKEDFETEYIIKQRNGYVMFL